MSTTRFQRTLAQQEFATRYSHALDDQRAEWRGPGIRRLIDFWELVRDQDTWVSATDFAPTKSSDGRWVRRQLKYLAAGGLIELEKTVGGLVFRRQRNRRQAS